MAIDRQQAILAEHGLRPLKSLQDNPVKGLIVQLVADDLGRKLVMKFSDSGSTNTQTLDNELSFYRNEPPHFAPQLRYSGQDYLCIDYVEGVSVLKYLASEHIAPQELELLPGAIADMVNFFAAASTAQKGDLQEFVTSYMRYLTKLFNSGPWGSQRGRLEDFLLRRCWKILRTPLHRRIRKLLETTNQMPSQHFVHRDMHQNNILRDKDGKLYLIDFENYGPGYPCIDIIYALSTLYATGKVEKNAIYRGAAQHVREFKAFEALLNVGLCTVQVNRRFYAGTAFNLMRNLAKLFSFAVMGLIPRP